MQNKKQKMHWKLLHNILTNKSFKKNEFKISIMKENTKQLQYKNEGTIYIPDLSETIRNSFKQI